MYFRQYQHVFMVNKVLQTASSAFKTLVNTHTAFLQHFLQSPSKVQIFKSSHFMCICVNTAFGKQEPHSSLCALSLLLCATNNYSSYVLVSLCLLITVRSNYEFTAKFDSIKYLQK